MIRLDKPQLLVTTIVVLAKTRHEAAADATSGIPRKP